MVFVTLADLVFVGRYGSRFLWGYFWGLPGFSLRRMIISGLPAACFRELAALSRVEGPEFEVSGVEFCA